MCVCMYVCMCAWVYEPTFLAGRSLSAAIRGKSVAPKPVTGMKINFMPGSPETGDPSCHEGSTADGLRLPPVQDLMLPQLAHLESFAACRG